MSRHAFVVVVLWIAAFVATADVRAQEPGAVADPVCAALIDELARARAVGPPIERVAFLGVARAPGIEGRLQEWLLPRLPDPERVAADLAAATATRFALAPPGEIPEPLAETAARLAAFDVTPTRIAELNLALDVDAVLVARIGSSWDPRRAPPVEAMLLSGRATAIAFTAEGAAPLPEAVLDWNPRAALWLVIPLLLLVLRPMRVAGTLVVHLELRAARADENVAYTAYVARRALAQDSSTKHVIQSHPLTGDTVSFRGLPAGNVFVSVRRVERDPKTLKVSANHLEERPLRLVRGRTASASFQFKADLTSVEVRLLQGEDRPVTEQAALAVRGQGASIRYLRTGSATLHLGEGSHLLLVGIGDRAFRVPLAIPPKTRTAEVKLHVDRADKALFSGCQDAVGPFVAGDFATAAAALETAGKREAAALLRAELCRARGERDEAIRLFEEAGHLEAAAELRAESGDDAATAELFERAGDLARAAQHYERAGRLANAARMHARATQWNEALRCAGESGDRALLAELLAAKGDSLDAARIALELGTTDQATRLLQSIPQSNAHYHEACLLLAQLFCTGGEPELALQKLDEAGDSETNLELREQIARRLEEKGELRLALEACEHIRKRDIRYPGMAERIESLRAQLREAPAAAPNAAAATRVALRREGGGEQRYDVEQEIGRGGMGVVFRARDRMLGRVVALKRLPENLKEHPTAVKLFLREARAVAALNHPNIVTLFDAGQEDGAYYITMEHLEGHPLHVPLQKRGRFPVNDAMRLGVQVMTGLGYAHEAGIVHRDIKPSNLFLTKQGRVKIMDFGLAKILEEVRKQASIIAGTPYYMAPEQAQGDAVDARADLYAFGVTLFELLTGEVPFKQGDVGYHHRHTPPPDPRQKIPEIPDALAELVLALMAKRPDDRPPTASGVREALAVLLRQR